MNKLELVEESKEENGLNKSEAAAVVLEKKTIEG